MIKQTKEYRGRHRMRNRNKLIVILLVFSLVLNAVLFRNLAITNVKYEQLAFNVMYAQLIALEQISKRTEKIVDDSFETTSEHLVNLHYWYSAISQIPRIDSRFGYLPQTTSKLETLIEHTQKILRKYDMLKNAHELNKEERDMIGQFSENLLSAVNAVNIVINSNEDLKKKDSIIAENMIEYIDAIENLSIF